MTRRSLRIAIVVTATAGLLIGAVAPAAAAPETPDVVIRGAGWGHGVGMSQYGAKGQADAGATADEIISYYYQGSSTAALSDLLGASNFLRADPDPIWVNLLRDRTRVSFVAVGGELTLCQGGVCDLAALPGETWRFEAVGSATCRYTRNGEPVTEPGACDGGVVPAADATIRVTDLDSGRHEFRRGKLWFRSPSGAARFHASLELSVEDYMLGIAEVPASWPAEAVRAQAIAARSYAAYKVLTYGPMATTSDARKAQCWCHLYATTADQNFVGAAAEHPGWVAAVAATAGDVITHPDAAYTRNGVAQGFYSSSTGGATENNEDVWGGSPWPYLRSVDDPWSVDPDVGNPFSEWEYSYSESALAAELGVAKIDGVEIVERYASGTPSLIEIHTRGSGGATAVITTTGSELRSLLGLRGKNIHEFDFGSMRSLVGDFGGEPGSELLTFLDFNAAAWLGTPGAETLDQAPVMNLDHNSDWATVTVGDFDGDGDTDVAGYRDDTGSWIVATNNNGTFLRALWAQHELQIDNWGPQLVGDFDGDGADDIAEFNRTNGQWQVLLHDGGSAEELADFDRSEGRWQAVPHEAGGFAPAEIWFDHLKANGWGRRIVGDFDGDGRDDIGAYNPRLGRVVVLFSRTDPITGQDSFVKSVWSQLPREGKWGGMVAADFNGDGVTDWAAYAHDERSWWVSLGQAGRRKSIAPEVWHTFLGGAAWTKHRTGDFDGDGRDDIASYRPWSRVWKVLTSDGTSFTRATWAQIELPHRGMQPHVADLEGDGRDDLIVFDSASQTWWLGSSTGDSFTIAEHGFLR